ncbi:MAG: DMT family transporter [Saprospiraceae bacterium]|nr:DMT family transporter [Saprospiraceae bacterium]
MFFTILCILCTSILGLIFKLAAKFECKTSRIIIINYWVCVIIGFSQNGNFMVDSFSTSWLPYLLALGFLFIIGFNWFAMTIHIVGLSISTLFQKMSIVLTVLVAIALGDVLNTIQWFGLFLGLLAIPLIYKTSEVKSKFALRPIIFLLGTLILSAAIEILFIIVGKKQFISTNIYSIFPGYIFGIAAILGLISHIIIHRSIQISFKELGFGVLLGIPNYYSIQSMMLALNQEFTGSLFFPILNCSVILIATLIGYLFFQENLTQRQWIGLLFSLISIVFISYYSV